MPVAALEVHYHGEKHIFRVLRETPLYYVTNDAFSQGIVALHGLDRRNKVISWEKNTGSRRGDTYQSGAFIKRPLSEVPTDAQIVY